MTRPAGAAAPPAVSVVLPFRNAAATLPDCLASIQGQTLADFEVLALDDGSEDESAVIVAQAAQRDPRLRLVQPGRVGLVAALNLGIAHARSALIARMDADDRMHPERLAAQLAFLAEQPAITLVAAQVELFPAEQIRAGYQEYVRWQNQCLTPAAIAANIYVESPVAHPSVMVRRSALERLGGYHAGPFPEDYELWLRMHQAGMLMAKLPRILHFWRERPDRTSRVDPRYARAAFDQVRARFLARDPRLHSGRPLVVWGAGRTTRLRVRLLLEQGIHLAAWIDIDPKKIGQRVWGLSVHAPVWLDQEPHPFVLVYVTNHGARDYIAGLLAQWNYAVGADYLAVG